MVFIALSQVFFITLLAGVGRLLWAGFGFESPRNPWLLAWLGFFASSTFAMGYALFLPMDWIPFSIFASCGLLGLVLLRRDWSGVQQRLAGVIRAFWGVPLLLFLVMAYTMAVRSWGMLEGDTSLYHAALVRWLNEYGTVPGLTNLHGRFGNVSSWFNFAALIEVGLWDGRSATLLPGVGLICGLMYILHEIVYGESSAGRTYAFIFFFFSLMLLHRYNRPTLYYDFPTLILNGIVILEALKVVMRGKGGTLSQLCLLTFLVASAFTVKTIPVISVLVVSSMVLWLLWRDNQITVRNLLCVFGLPTIGAGVWLANNIVLSGYPFFPLGIFAMPVDWLSPQEIVQGVYNDVRGWGRLPGKDYLLALSNGTWFWLKPWLIRVPVNHPGLIALPFVLGIACWCYALWRQRGKNISALFFLLWTGMGIIYWFIMSPDMRFGSGLLWSFFACAAVFAIPDSWMEQRVWVYRGVTVAIVITALILIVRTPVWQGTDPQWWSIPPMPSNDLVAYEVQNGVHPFIVWVPASGEFCNNAPLPCAPSGSPYIRLRDPLDMGAGFAPLNPYARHSR